MPNTIRLHRVLRATPERIYRAFLDPDAMLFSLGPALKASRADLVNDLKQQVGEPAHLGRLNRFFAPRHLLVMAQIALSLTLLFSAGLFFRAALKAGAFNPGFDRHNGISTEMDFTLGRQDEEAARRTMPAFVCSPFRREVEGTLRRLRATLGFVANH